MKVIFIGGGPWGTAVLKAVIDTGHEVIVAESLKLNKRKGLRNSFLFRKILHSFKLLQIIYSFLTNKKNIFYETIWKYHLPTLLTDSLNKPRFIKRIKSLRPDVILVSSCSEILDKKLINAASVGSINCHPSLLPKYRGTDPFFWVLRNKERKTGVTFHFLTDKIDAGDIIFQKEIDVEEDDSEESLVSKCAGLASGMVKEMLKTLKSGNINRKTQDEREATYYPPLIKQSSDKLSSRELSDSEVSWWDGYIRSSHEYNFFSTLPWLEVASKAIGYPYKIIVCDYQGKPLCGCAGLVRNTVEGSLFTGAPLGQYNTILSFLSNPNIDRALEPKTRDEIHINSLLTLSDYIKNKFDWCILSLHPSFKEKTIFQREKWDINWRSTYYLDLRDKNRLYVHFDNMLKRNIKKCDKNKFEFRYSFKDFFLFYELWRDTFLKRKIKPPLKYKDIKFIYDKLKDKFFKTICAYDKNNELAAGIIFLVDGNFAYYWASALNYKFSNSGINQSLLWEGLQMLSDAGVTTFDFVGADIPSIAYYKKQFSGELVSHLQIAYVSSFRAKIIRSMKKLVKKTIKQNDG